MWNAGFQAGHDSEQLGLPAQNWAHPHSVCNKEELMGFHPSLRVYMWVVVVNLGGGSRRKIIFFIGVTTGRLPMFL